MLGRRNRVAPVLLDDRGWRFYGLTTRDRPDRTRRLTAEFRRAAISVEVVVSDRPSDSNGFVSAGTWGCFAAHLGCLRRAREDGAAVAVLAEDDVVLTRRMHRHLSAVVEQLAGLDWSMVYLGHLPESPATAEGMQRLTGNVARLAGWEVLGAHLYAVHARALDALIEDFESRLADGGHRIPADGVLNEFRRDNGLDTLVCVPNLAHQAPSPSGIAIGRSGRDRAKNAALRNTHVQRVAESIKRLGWDAAAAAPPAVHVRWWELRRRAGRR